MGGRKLRSNAIRQVLLEIYWFLKNNISKAHMELRVQPSPVVTLAVCGIFHYRNTVGHIHSAGVLNRFIYSHRLRTNSRALGVPAEKLSNIWLKEYFVHSYRRLFRNRGEEHVFPLCHDIWDALAANAWRPSPVLHVMMHGTSRRLISRGKSDGAFIIGEPVNAHPLEQHEILRAEYQRLGIKQSDTLNRQEHRLLEEVEQVDHLLVPSSFVRDSYVTRGYDPSRITLLPWGVDTSRFSLGFDADSAEPERKKFRVICVGTICPRKGQAYLLEAWKKLALPDSELVLVGPIEAGMADVLKSYSGLFQHFPHIPHAELKDQYLRSNVFVLPSLEDGFAYVCAEAMACGLPVVTTANTGAAELITDGEDGYVLPICSATAIENTLRNLHEDRELREALGASARRKALQMDWSTYSNSLVSFYNAICAPKRPQAPPLFHRRGMAL